MSRLCWILSVVSATLTFQGLPVEAGSDRPCTENTHGAFDGHMLGTIDVADAYALTDGPSVTQPVLAQWVVERLNIISAVDFSDRDVVIYVHGFMTSIADSRCQAIAVRDSLSTIEPYSSSQRGPNLIVFAWPGDLEVWEFSRAQAIAAQSSVALNALLNAIKNNSMNKKIIIVAHSLGAQVAMDALHIGSISDLNEPLVAAVILVQGAIPAVSIRSWKGDGETRFPSTELDTRINLAALA